MNGLKQPLQGILVVTVEHAVAAPLCSRHLSELGAEVIKIEPPLGDFARRYDSVVKEESAHSAWLNAGKKSVTFDLKKPDDRLTLTELLHDADVLLSNLGPGVIQSRLDFTEIQNINPRLIHCIIDGYGANGPFSDRRAYDLIIQGEAGLTLNTGTPEAPAKSGCSLADLAAGVYAFSAILAALRQREITGEGLTLEISLFDCLAEWMMPLLLTQRETGQVPQPVGARHATIAPYGPYETADGQLVNIGVQNEQQWQHLCQIVLRDPDLGKDPLFATNPERIVNRAALEQRVADGVRRLTLTVLSGRLEEARMPWGKLNSLSEVLAHPQLHARRRWQSVVTVSGYPFEILAPPFLDAAAVPKGRQIPGVGQHSAEIIRRINRQSA
jgi:itaconate CoA-transferase